MVVVVQDRPDDRHNHHVNHTPIPAICSPFESTLIDEDSVDNRIELEYKKTWDNTLSPVSGPYTPRETRQSSSFHLQPQV